MENAKIFNMQIGDVLEVVRLENACFSEPWSEDGIKAELEKPSSYFIVAKSDNKTLGYAGMHTVCGEGYITNIAVFNEYRRQGIGRLLLKNMIEYAKHNSFEFITLEVRASNKGAINLYSSQGFRVMGERKNFYSRPVENALIMTKSF